MLEVWKLLHPMDRDLVYVYVTTKETGYLLFVSNLVLNEIAVNLSFLCEVQNIVD